MLTVSEYGKEHLVPMIAAVEEAAAEVGIPKDSLRMAGPPVDNATIDQVSENMRQPLMILAGVLGFGLSWWYLRQFRLSVMVFLGGAYSAVLSLAIVHLFGGTMNSVLFTMPAVVYTGGLSAAIHLVNYYRHARASRGAGRLARAGAEGGLGSLPAVGRHDVAGIDLAVYQRDRADPDVWLLFGRGRDGGGRLDLFVSAGRLAALAAAAARRPRSRRRPRRPWIESIGCRMRWLAERSSPGRIGFGPIFMTADGRLRRRAVPHENHRQPDEPVSAQRSDHRQLSLAGGKRSGPWFRWKSCSGSTKR